MHSNEFNRIQEETLRSRAQAAERVGWFSGATISLSFTLLGFLLSERAFVYLIRTSAFLVWVLIFAWIFLGLSVLASLLIRLKSEQWLADTATHIYLTNSGEQFAQAMNTADPSLATAMRSRANNRMWWFMKMEHIIYAGAMFGIILSLVFLIALVLLYR